MLRSWAAAACVLALVSAAAVSYSIVRIPLQVTDCLIPILKAQATPSVAAATLASFRNPGYLRPFRIGQIQLLYEAARGRHYFEVYKGFHVALVAAAFILFVAVLRVRTRTDFLVAAFALTVFSGLHTFLGTVWEAYPFNHFLEIGVCCLAALALAQSRGGWWSDLLACVLFVVAALTLESGLLVWVVAAAAWLTGLRGISKRAVLVMTLLLGGYMVLRFAILATGAPSLAERSSGFGTERLEPAELIARFGDRRLVFYAYNVGASALTVLASEPRNGEWRIAQDLAERNAVMEGTALNVIVSLATTLAIGAFFLLRVRDWRHGRIAWPDHLVLVAAAVLAANAAISFGYTKDEIMSPAGMFYALAAYAAVRELVTRLSVRHGAIRLAAAVVLCVIALGWDLRAAGLHYQTRRMAFTVRNEWVVVDRWLAAQHATPRTAPGRQLVTLLQDDALRRPVTNPYFFPRWVRRWIR
jgi:hypothetical protein